jgi:hypothetical protein
MVCSPACPRAQLDESRSRAVSGPMSSALFDDNLEGQTNLWVTLKEMRANSGRQQITERENL